jgi:putative tryptophan/tyrosine transport system substrate-binding protein
MRRRQFIGLFAAAVASRPVITLGQVSPQRPLIAYLGIASQAAGQHSRNALRQGLQELGYVEGRDYDIEYRYADGDVTRQPAQAERHRDREHPRRARREAGYSQYPDRHDIG